MTAIFKELKLDRINDYYILAGDLNAKNTEWGDEVANHRGNCLLRWVNDNKIRFRTVLVSPEYPSYPAGESYLDLLIHDSRIKITNMKNNKIRVLNYDSDHNVITFKIKIENIDKFLFEPNSKINYYNFSKTNWKKFTNNLEKLNLKINDEKNLTNPEIEQYLNDLTSTIKNELYNVTPIHTQNDSIDRYLNSEIIKLQKLKGKILSILHTLKCRKGAPESVLSTYKKLLVIIKQNLQTVFNSSVNNYWINRIAKIKPHDSSNMFPQIKSIFKEKNIDVMPNLVIPKNNKELINNNVMNVNKGYIVGDNIIVSDRVDKANLLAKFLADINNKKRTSNSGGLERIVERTVNEFVESINDPKGLYAGSILKFDKQNKSSRPIYNEQEHYFFDIVSLKLIIGRLNAKKSCGIDKLPNVAIKKLPTNIVSLLLILFNNLINNGHFPNSWKLAKITPI